MAATKQASHGGKHRAGMGRLAALVGDALPDRPVMNRRTVSTRHARLAHDEMPMEMAADSGMDPREAPVSDELQRACQSIAILGKKIHELELSLNPALRPEDPIGHGEAGNEKMGGIPNVCPLVLEAASVTALLEPLHDQVESLIRRVGV